MEDDCAYSAKKIYLDRVKQVIIMHLILVNSTVRILVTDLRLGMPVGYGEKLFIDYYNKKTDIYCFRVGCDGQYL